MRCVGVVEFMCEFQSECHTTQKNLGFTIKDISGGENENEQALKENTEKLKGDQEKSEENTEVQKEKIETTKEIDILKDSTSKKIKDNKESDKENVLPSKGGKRKGKLLQSGQLKSISSKECDENIHLYEVDENDLLIDKSIEKEIIPYISANSDQSNVTMETDSTIIEIISKNATQSSHLLKQEKTKRISKCHRKSLFIGSKNKNINNKHARKTIDKFFVTKSECERKCINEENQSPNRTESTLSININRDIEENIIFEGTVVNSLSDSSIVMPLETKSCNNQLKLDNAIMADGSKIVHAQEVFWISNNSQLPEPEKPTAISSYQFKNTSPAPGDEAEIMEQTDDRTLVLQAPEQDASLNISTEQLIVVEVQLPAKENSVDVPNNIETTKRTCTVSSSSFDHKSSEVKFAKISQLMTEEQKKNIETHYRVDMSVVDEGKVNNLVVVQDKNQFKCKTCEATYSRFDKCQVHIWRHLEMKPYFCKICPFTTLTVSNVRCHIRKSHLKIKPFVCHLCHKCYNSATLLEEHLNTHTNTRPYRCESCCFASTSKQVLAHHILTHKNKKDFICDICGKAFYSKGRMRTHQLIHNKDRAYKCSLCSVYVSNLNALERHVNNVHTKKYKCNICQKEYRSKKALHNHESVHSEAKFQCPQCPNVYKSSHILREHILKHQGIRKYKCNNCNKTFAQQSHLAAHMAVHSDITYNCPGCKKGFNRHDNMKVHARRCEKFLANPELQSLLIKRKISVSKNHTAKASAQKKNPSSLKNHKKNKILSKKTVDESMIENIESNDSNVTETKTVLSTHEF